MRYIHKSWGNGPRKRLGCYPPYLRSCGIDCTLSKLVNKTKLCDAVSSPSRMSLISLRGGSVGTLWSLTRCPGFSQGQREFFAVAMRVKSLGPYGHIYVVILQHLHHCQGTEIRDSHFWEEGGPGLRWRKQVACGGSPAILSVFQGSKQRMKWWGKTDPNWREFPPLFYIVLGLGKKMCVQRVCGAILFFILGSCVVLGWVDQSVSIFCMQITLFFISLLLILLLFPTFCSHLLF